MVSLSDLEKLQELKQLTDVNKSIQITELMRNVLELSSVLEVDQYGKKTITFNSNILKVFSLDYTIAKEVKPNKYYIDSNQLIPILIDLIKFQQLSIQALSLRLQNLEHKNEC